jgi:hypothetical protein
MTLLDGEKVPPMEIKERIWWHNIHRLRMWSTVGAHKEYGLFAIYGARLGTWMTNCTDWDYIQVRDFEYLRTMYDDCVKHLENDQDKLMAAITEVGEKIKLNLGLDWPNLDTQQSKFTLELYDETIELVRTYYKR